jgi:hypothetical protein
MSYFPCAILLFDDLYYLLASTLHIALSLVRRIMYCISYVVIAVAFRMQCYY